MRKTIIDIIARKGANNQPLVCLTAYTAPMAKLLDEQCDVILVGDSVAMVLYGEPSTLQADMEMMIRHGRAVVNATSNALVVVDMPFGSYQESKEVAFRNAARILKETNATCVKLEGGAEMAHTIAYLSQRAVPVMGHIGLQPQSVNTMGGFKAQGMNDKAAQKIMDDAKAVAASGAFAIVLEGVAEQLAADITKAVLCPVIGIGASAACDGQILVTEDMLGLNLGRKPKFVREYGTLAADIEKSVRAYADDVKARAFPGSTHVYGGKDNNTVAQPTTATPAPQHQSALQAVKPSYVVAPVQAPAANKQEAKEEPRPFSAFGGVLRATPKKLRDY